MDKAVYGTAFFEQMGATSRPSGVVIAEWLVGLARPESVLDLGCGEGAWVSGFLRAGVADAIGVDGDYVDRGRLLVPPEQFRTADVSRPLDLARKFDLAVCVEVAEHLPVAGGDELLRTLARHADVVLFSAAIPDQQGTDHVNEQWPAYWVERMTAHGYEPFDVVRPRFWGDAGVAGWYRQNAMLFLRGDAGYPGRLRPRLTSLESFQCRPLVHPEVWSQLVGLAAHRVGPAVGPTPLLAGLPAAVARAVKRRLGLNQANPRP